MRLSSEARRLKLGLDAPLLFGARVEVAGAGAEGARLVASLGDALKIDAEGRARLIERSGALVGHAGVQEELGALREAIALHEFIARLIVLSLLEIRAPRHEVRPRALIRGALGGGRAETQ